ncbi:class I SAM-dependent methyltransferase [Hyphomicrobium sp.]|uniref:class I SAM-dependent DNA methyltransferase n=1 Tax=Hyphomicrobium sp. TaxID=82 RepID=UPI000FADE1B7|nr:class I SAM-dependent methyltransferase [Hyphomicrobium sp.]RUP00497.1 MAG: class I SAM-dependent methyltransferase [Hyphomicrobium sp.]
MSDVNSEADRIIGLYDRHAQVWDEGRSRSLFERAWLSRFLDLVPCGASLLDIGCGSGEPIAGFFIRAGYDLVGVDSSAAMIALCSTRHPTNEWHVADMRALSLGRTFAGILAWDSFFHLTQSDQRGMFRLFREHAAPGAALMFTSGPRDGVAMGVFFGEPLFHASLDPEEYRTLLSAHGFETIAHVAEDPATGGHTIWLARLK